MTRWNLFAVALVLVGWVSHLFAPPSQAGGFRIYEQGAAAAGQANAFTAQADDPSAIHYNPAGLTQLRGVQAYGGAVLAGGWTNYSSPAGLTTRGSFGNSIASPAPFNLYVAANLKDVGVSALDGWTVGVGLTTPFGLVYRYPTTAPFATAVYREELPLIDVKPTIAYRVNEQLSIGVGADIYTFSGLFGSSTYNRQFMSPGAFGIPAGVPMELNGRDTAAGFNVSLMYTPFRNHDGKPLVNIGLIYRSQATLHLSGDLLANGGAVTTTRSTVVLPQVFTAGLAIWPVRNEAHEWKLELDVDYTGWQSVRNTDVHLGTGATIPFPQNWRGGYTTMVGTEFRWLSISTLPHWEVAARAGYRHSQTPIPDAAFLPTLADADHHVIAAGFGTLCKAGGRFLGLSCGSTQRFLPSAVGLDVAYEAFLYEPRTVTGNVNPLAPGLINGTYRTTFHVASLNLRLMF